MVVGTVQDDLDIGAALMDQMECLDSNREQTTRRRRPGVEANLRSVRLYHRSGVIDCVIYSEVKILGVGVVLAAQMFGQPRNRAMWKTRSPGYADRSG